MNKSWIAAAVSLWVPFAGAAYKCVDAKGVTHFGDTPPPGCAAVMMYEVTPSGKVLRAIEPTPTPEQLKTLQAEQERKREADKKATEQKRKDTALLSTYASEKEFDTARDRNIEPLTLRINSAQERIEALDKREQALKEQMEFYTSGKSKKKEVEMPPSLPADMKRVQADRATLAKSIANYEKEIEQIKVKYDTDKKRWVELKSGSAGKKADSAAALAKRFQHQRTALQRFPFPARRAASAARAGFR